MRPNPDDRTSARRALMALVAGALLLLPTGAAAAERPREAPDPVPETPPAPPEGVELLVRRDGVSSSGTYSVGDIVATYPREGDTCVIDEPVGVGAVVADGGPDSASVSTRFNKDCELVIVAIEAGPVPRRGSPDSKVPAEALEAEGEPAAAGRQDVAPLDAGPPHQHTGWVHHRVLEQFDLTATETYNELDYWQDWSGVYSASAGGSWCGHSVFPWELVWCTQTYSSSGVWSELSGRFEHWPNIEYTMESYWGAGSAGFSYWCQLANGSLPWLWEERCSGGRT